MSLMALLALSDRWNKSHLATPHVPPHTYAVACPFSLRINASHDYPSLTTRIYMGHLVQTGLGTSNLKLCG